MTDFPPQSHASREPRQIQPVTTVEARVRKAPLLRRLRENIIQENGATVWSTMLWDVLLPGARDVISNVFHEAVDLTFQGSRGGYRRNFSGGSNINVTRSQISKHNPDRVLGGSSNDRHVQEGLANHDFTVIEIDSRVEAEEVLTQMNFLIDQFDICTLADFKVMVRISPNPLDYKFGWEDIGGARAIASRGSYYLDLPRPIQLK